MEQEFRTLRAYFLKSARIGFSRWQMEDRQLAAQLWGDPEVTKLICASGRFIADEIAGRLEQEIERQTAHHVQYWPIFELDSNAFIGCCGLRPKQEGGYELGFHLRPEFWGQGYASEAARAVIAYAFQVLHAPKLFAGHNPKNSASRKVLVKLGFGYTGDAFYAPTGLYHPSYELKPMK